MEPARRLPSQSRPSHFGSAVSVSVGIHGLLLLGCLTLRAGEPSLPGPLSVEIVDARPRLAAPRVRDVTVPSRVARPALERKKKARSRPQGGDPDPPRSLALSPRPVKIAAAGEGHSLLSPPAAADPGHGTAAGGSGGAGSDAAGSGAGGRGEGGNGGGGTGSGAPASARREPAASPPCPLASPPPDYPFTARRRGAQGLVLVRARVGAEGKVVETRLAGSSGWRDLDASALEAVRSWRFRPALQGNRAVEAWVNVPVRFRLGSGGL